MGGGKDGYGPQDGTQRGGGEVGEVTRYVCRVAIEFAHKRGEDILEAPSRHYGVITRDEETGEHAHIADKAPGAAAGDARIGTGCVGSTVSADYELAEYAGQAKQEDADNIDDDERGTTVLTCHIRESPHITQSYC